MSQSDRQRILRYATFWQFYLGRHWAWKREEGEPQITINYSRVFVNKGISFLWSKGWNVAVPSDKNKIIVEELEKVWKDNNKQLWGLECGQMGSVAGDTFIKVCWEEPTPENGLKEGRIKLVILDSSNCFPTWHPHNKDLLLKFRIAYQYEVDDLQGHKARKKYTEVLTSDKVIILDDQVRYEIPNGLGFIPIVHIKNYPVAGASYGLSDLNDFTQLNREINEKFTNISDVINYHQAPVTIVKGAKASSLERGANKVWSGLPKDSDVFNLELHSDLAASVNYIAKLKEVMHEVGNIPEGTLGKSQAASNTSGVALHMLYEPLMEMRADKMNSYGTGLKLINKMILRLLEIKKGLDLDFLKDRYETDIVWPDPLPKDRLLLLQEIQQRMSMPFPLITPRKSLELLGEEDIDKFLEELAVFKASGGNEGGARQDQPRSEITGGENRFANVGQPPSGMDTGVSIGNAGGMINKATMTPQGAAQSEMFSVRNLGPGW